MVIVTLLDPETQMSQQQWYFEQGAVIWVGRALENDVVLISPLVSRRHLELRCQGQDGEFRNHGANGLYRAGESISQGTFTETICLQLARGGPMLRCDLVPAEQVPPDAGAGTGAIAQGTRSTIAAAAPSKPSLPVASLQLPPLPVLGKLSPSRGGGVCTHRGNPVEGLLCIHCGQPLRVERQIQQYQVLRVLGRGGMGTTYLAWNGSVVSHANRNALAEQGANLSQKGLLVLKEMNANMVQIPKARELFEREAATLKALNHVGIPQFYDFFVEAGKSYLAMELLHGQDLEKRVVQQGPVDPPQAIAWMLQTCEILDYLHHRPQPIIHRDVKPGNLLVQTATNRVVLLDFGAVKAAGLTVGTRIGAEGYSAPEQTQGRPVVQSDLYSVGPTLVFLLTGQKPQRFYKRRGEGFGLVVDAIPEIPPALKGVIRRVTELRPSDRYRSARELAQVLAACQ